MATIAPSSPPPPPQEPFIHFGGDDLKDKFNVSKVVCPTKRNPVDDVGLKKDKEAGDEPDFGLNQEQRIGLVSFLYFWGTIVVYTLLGAWIFQLLERQPELKRINATHHVVESARNTLLNQLTTMIQFNSSANARNVSSSNSTTVTPTTMDQQLLIAIRSYEHALDSIMGGELHVYLDRDVDPLDTNWSMFSRAVAFVVTLITTIGYGNITPKTPGGRIFCILYALIGIPLMLIAISKSGKTFAHLCGQAYRRLCGTRFDWKYLQSEDPTHMQLMVGTSVSVSGVLTILFVYMSIGAAMYRYAEGWTYLDAFYFCFITLTTIGLGDLTPHIETTPTIFAVMRSMYILIGLAVTSTAIELVRKQYTYWNRPWKRVLEVRKAQLEECVHEGRAIVRETCAIAKEKIKEVQSHSTHHALDNVAGTGTDAEGNKHEKKKY